MRISVLPVLFIYIASLAKNKKKGKDEKGRETITENGDKVVAMG